MTRLPDWEKRLADYIVEAKAKTFQWGNFDCALAVCDAIRAETGTDVGAAYRGRYSTLAGALNLLGNDLGTFAASVASGLGMAEVRPTFARRGDAVLLDNGDPTKALGIVDLGGRFAWCAGQNGMVRKPMSTWLRAWKVG